ncbi:ABC transporter permease [Hutsoniella sourekii]|uniref:ABC transporter permease n=1 Tax=Hutsoniella sourekii TaxID=87650 RepID=UPI000489919F|nr:ABC transporter permease [Hutsoniella sourekii]
MLNYLKAECYQWQCRNTTRMSFLGFAGLAFLAPFILRWVITHSSVVQIEYDGGFSNSSDFLVMTFQFFFLIMLSACPFIIGGLVDALFNNENQNRTFINTLSNRFSRLQVYSVKWLAAFIGCLIYLLAVSLMYLLAYAIAFGGPMDQYLKIVFIDIMWGCLPYFVMFLSLHVSWAFNTNRNFSIIFLVLIAIKVMDSVLPNVWAGYQQVSPYLFDELQ